MTGNPSAIPPTPQQIKAVMRFASSQNRTLIASEIRRTLEHGGYFFQGVKTTDQS